VIDGGAGYDYFEGWGQPEQLQRQPTVSLTLDGVANDGRPGENDNVTNVEDFQMYVVGSFTGSDGPEAIVDAIDIVTNCETVEGAGSNGGPAAPGGPGGGKITVTIPAAKLAAVAAKGLKVKVSCAAACSATGSLTADAATARKLGTRKVASGSVKAAKAGTATVTLKVAKKVARKLKRLKSAKGTVKVTVRQGGTTRSISRKLTIKR